MLDAQAVLDQVRQGRVPASWRVYPMRRGADVLRLIVSIVALGVLAFIGVGLAIAVGGFSFISGQFPSSFGNGGSIAGGLFFLFFGLIATVILIAVLYNGVTAFIALLQPDAARPVLVLLPEGAVERRGTLRRRVRAVSYADLAGVELKTRTTTTTTRDQATGMTTRRTSTSIGVLLRYLNGKTDLWWLHGGFADPAMLAQSIIAAQAQYATAQAMRRR